MSYPERYVNAFLAQLNISFHRQYMVPFEIEGKRSHYKYDFTMNREEFFWKYMAFSILLQMFSTGLEVGRWR